MRRTQEPVLFACVGSPCFPVCGPLQHAGDEPYMDGEEGVKKNMGIHLPPFGLFGNFTHVALASASFERDQ